MTVEWAVAAFMADSRDRGNSVATLQKKAPIFERRMARDPNNSEGLIPSQATSLLRSCDEKGTRFPPELDLNAVRDWHPKWKVNSLVRHKRQGQVIGLPHPHHFSVRTRSLVSPVIDRVQPMFYFPDHMEYSCHRISMPRLRQPSAAIGLENWFALVGIQRRLLRDVLVQSGKRYPDQFPCPRRHLW